MNFSINFVLYVRLLSNNDIILRFGTSPILLFSSVNLSMLITWNIDWSSCTCASSPSIATPPEPIITSGLNLNWDFLFGKLFFLFILFILFLSAESLFKSNLFNKLLLAKIFSKEILDKLPTDWVGVLLLKPPYKKILLLWIKFEWRFIGTPANLKTSQVSILYTSVIKGILFELCPRPPIIIINSL